MKKIKSDEISWADQAVDESEDYLKNGEYEEAKAVLEEADRVITQGSGILQQMNRVKEYSPVKLTDLTPFFEEDDGYGTILDEWTVQDKDNLGNGGNVEPVDIEVNISGMNRLKIGFYIGTPRASILLDDVSAYGFINPTLQKTYEPK